ncbi:MAG: transcriptional regulator [bacterium]|nr:transcriptional regulator [bacterium]
MKAESFLTTHSLFDRDEFAAVLHERGRSEATVAAHLARWTRQGRIARVKQGVYVRVDTPPRPPDFVALASRMAPDAAVAYHTALEVHGYAQSLFERLTFVTATGAKPTTFQGRVFVPVRPRAPLLNADRGERWVERVERAGIEIRVTDLERTVLDALDRPALAGGLEEVWRSLAQVPALDPTSLQEYVGLLDSKTLAAKLGFFVESRREELAVPATLLAWLRTRVPASPVYMDRARRGRLVARWALIVPPELHEHPEGVRE